MIYVVAAYVVTIAIIGGYLLTIVARRRAVERQLAALEEGANAPSGGFDPGAPGGETFTAAPPDP